MGIGEDFKSFCDKIKVQDLDSIRNRYKRITKQLNKDFWKTDSDTAHSIYAGSYGRGTAVDKTSDVDMIFWLPGSDYKKYDEYKGNGQSAMLADVRTSMKKTYSTSDIAADGQVVVVNFDDGRKFEVLPAFELQDAGFRHPDSNNGGSWRDTYPRAEIDEMISMDNSCNGNLRNLCKMVRAWKTKWDVPVSGLLIDTLAYYFIRDYAHKDKSYLYYDFMSRDFFDYLSKQENTQEYWKSPGSGQYVWRTGKFEKKADSCRDLAKKAIELDGEKKHSEARAKWREIYGSEYPS